MYLFYFCFWLFFSFLWLVKFQTKILLYDNFLRHQIVFFVFYFSWFSKNCVFHLFFKKTYFPKSFFPFFPSSVVICVYGFNQTFKLNLMSLCTFFETNPWFNACVKFLMWVTYFFYHRNWLQVFQLFQFSLSLVIMVNHYGAHVMFQDIEHQLQEISFITISIVAFYEIFIKSRWFSIHLKRFMGNFCDNAYRNKLYILIFWIWWFFSFIIIYLCICCWLLLIVE